MTMPLSLIPSQADDVSEATEFSTSDYEGNIHSTPSWMYFGPKECLAIFELPSDRSAFLRVCEKEHSACKRSHGASRQGERRIL